MKLQDLAAHIKATLHLPVGAPTDALTRDFLRVAPIASAGPGDVTFVASKDFEAHLASTGAGAVIVATKHDNLKIPQLVHSNPYYAFARCAQAFYQPPRPAAGIHSGAVVDASAEVDPTATVFPLAYVGRGARVGPRAIVYPGAFVGAGAEVGADSELRANAVLEHGCVLGARVVVHAGAVLGADGFGFAPGPDGIAKIPQTGRVVVEDDVEIGGLTTVDRGALEDTRIGRGSKLDSHVHVGHGAVLGEHVMMCGFSGLAGSAVVGNRVIIAGHTGVNNKVKIADGVVVGAMTGVTGDLDEPGEYIGFPAVPSSDWKRQVAHTRRLPLLDKRVRALEERVAKLVGADDAVGEGVPVRVPPPPGTPRK